MTDVWTSLRSKSKKYEESTGRGTRLPFLNAHTGTYIVQADELKAFPNRDGDKANFAVDCTVMRGSNPDGWAEGDRAVVFIQVDLNKFDPENDKEGPKVQSLKSLSHTILCSHILQGDSPDDTLPEPEEIGIDVLQQQFEGGIGKGAFFEVTISEYKVKKTGNTINIFSFRPLSTEELADLD